MGSDCYIKGMVTRLNLSIFLIVFLCGTLCLPGQTLEELLSQGDALFAQRQDMDKARQAVEAYRQALQLQLGSYEANWKMARAVFSQGFLSGKKEERLQCFSQAVDFAKAAVAAKPDAVEGHFWLASSYCMYGDTHGVLKSMFLVDDIKAELSRVVEIDDRYACGSAYTALGRLYFKLPGLFGGSNKKSRQYLEKARDICPDTTTTLLYLAELYWDSGEKKLAVETLEKLLQIAPIPEFAPEAAQDLREARLLLEKYQKKLS